MMIKVRGKIMAESKKKTLKSALKSALKSTLKGKASSKKTVAKKTQKSAKSAKAAEGKKKKPSPPKKASSAGKKAKTPPSSGKKAAIVKTKESSSSPSTQEPLAQAAAVPDKPVKISKKAQKLLEENERRWTTFQTQNQEVKAALYKVSGNYQEQTPLQHKSFGWGYILSVKNNRMEVIFKDSIRNLASNNLGVMK